MRSPWRRCVSCTRAFECSRARDLHDDCVAAFDLSEHDITEKGGDPFDEPRSNNDHDGPGDRGLLPR